MDRKRFGDLLKEMMESGMLVRWNYILSKNMKDFCTDPEVFDRYNSMADLLVSSRGLEIGRFEDMLDRALELWTGLEQEFPLISEKEVEVLVRRNVGLVDFRMCAELAMKMGRHAPMKFSGVMDIARRCDSFRGVGEGSMNRVLSRVLGYLESSGLIIKTWASGGKGRTVRSMYFRLYRVFEGKKQECRECDFVRELRELLRKFEESQAEKARGSNSPDDPSQHPGR